MNIPDIYHFIWIGNSKPYFLTIAIQSVLLRCKGAQVILWTDNLEDKPDLLENDRFTLRKIDFEELAGRLDQEAKDLYYEIFEIAGSKSSLENTRPLERSRSNLLRYMILYIYGGVYLDADTLVLKDLAPLNRTNTAYFGKENSVWPIVKRGNPLHRFIWAPLLEVVRFIASNVQSGYKWNRLYRWLCGSSENNAVLGFTSKHNYLRESFKFISTMDRAEILRPLRLGPFLFQRMAKIYTGNDFTCYPEIYFYPYGPLISQHFFRTRRDAEQVANYMVSEKTHVLHWGASTKFLKQYTRERLLQSSKESVFHLLCHQVITEYEARYSKKI